MEWKIAADAPIYQQLSRQIRLGIVSGEYAPGERLPPVRALRGKSCPPCGSWRSRRG